jgi:hypothetical protein
MTIRDEFRVFTSPLPSARTQWAGAQRPKASPATVPDGLTAHLTPTNVFTGTFRPKTLDLKLRQQAARLGMIPGSPRWRAYVLGTVTAAATKKRKKR